MDLHVRFCRLLLRAVLLLEVEVLAAPELAEQLNEGALARVRHAFEPEQVDLGVGTHKEHLDQCLEYLVVPCPAHHFDEVYWLLLGVQAVLLSGLVVDKALHGDHLVVLGLFHYLAEWQAGPEAFEALGIDQDDVPLNLVQLVLLGKVEHGTPAVDEVDSLVSELSVSPSLVLLLQICELSLVLRALEPVVEFLLGLRGRHRYVLDSWSLDKGL